MRGKRGSWERKGISKGTRTAVACTQGPSHTQTVEIGVHLGWMWEGRGSTLKEARSRSLPAQ